MKSEVYKGKRNGPNTVPCGAPELLITRGRAIHFDIAYSEGVHDPGCIVRVQLHCQQLIPSKAGLVGVESTGDVKEHDSHSAALLLQVCEDLVYQEDDVFPTQSAAGPGNELVESSGATGPDIFMT